MATNGPTLNDRYNAALATWVDDGHNARPSCEHCDRDMTGIDVHEGRFGWYCSSRCCRLEERGGESGVDEQRAEARQMGLTAL